MNPKKQQIINAAYTLFIHKGYNASSIQDILDEASVSKGTFYNYFTSKTECLIAIMESIGSEIRQKRIDAAAGKPLSDPDVLVEQLCIRIQLNKEKNLFTLYESIFFSQDEELKKFAKDIYAAELDWIASRIVDIFGAEANAYALENAAIIQGSIQQLIHLWKISYTEELPTKELSAFVVRRLTAAISGQIETGDSFLQKTRFPAEQVTLETLRQDLKIYAIRFQDNKELQQLLSFLTDELKEAEPRKALIESVLSTLENEDAIDSELSIVLGQIKKCVQVYTEI